MSPIRPIAALLLAVLIALLVAMKLTWSALDRHTPEWDEAAFAAAAFELHDALADSGLSAGYDQFLKTMFWKAPMTSVWPVPFIAVFGRGSAAASLGTLLFIPALMIYVYRFARRFRGRRTALAAAYLTACCPLLYGLCNLVFAEYSLAALTAAAAYHLMASDGFRKRTHCLALGIVVGLGALTKILFFLYVGPLWLMAGALWLRRVQKAPDAPSRREAIRRPLLSLLMIAAIALALAGPWYAVNLSAVLQHSSYASTWSAPGAQEVSATRAILDYLADCAVRGVSPWLAAMMIATTIGIAAQYLRGRRRAGKNSKRFPPLALAMLAAWLAPFLVFLIMPNKEIRYLAPLLPAFCILLAVLLRASLLSASPVNTQTEKAERQKVSPGNLWLIGIVMLPAGALAINALFGVGDGRLKGPLRLARPIAYCGRPDPVQWPLKQVLEAAIAQAGAMPGERTVNPGGRIRFTVVSATPHFNVFSLRCEAARARLPVDLFTTAYTSNRQKIMAMAMASQGLLLKSGGESEPGMYNTQRDSFLEFVTQQSLFVPIPLNIPMPDGSQVQLYRKE
ncbi:MAG: glycosyltransferase family 39 protein [Candidatus Sumerlaeota bacterium]|nr:glycosyltransferase family 39 protein [Candidatus Sumerlaeota bacterium]